VVLVAGGLAGGVSITAVGYALLVGGAADEVGDCLGVFGGVGGDAIAADAGVCESFLGTNRKQ
jgi:hypothetical protein